MGSARGWEGRRGRAWIDLCGLLVLPIEIFAGEMSKRKGADATSMRLCEKLPPLAPLPEPFVSSVSSVP